MVILKPKIIYLEVWAFDVDEKFKSSRFNWRGYHCQASSISPTHPFFLAAFDFLQIVLKFRARTPLVAFSCSTGAELVSLPF